jgi:hypothetical protein
MVKVTVTVMMVVVLLAAKRIQRSWQPTENKAG